MFRKISSWLIAFILIPQLASAQGQLTVGTAHEDFYRREQLLGKFDSNISFLIRPINNKHFGGNPYLIADSIVNKAPKLQLLPVISRSKYLLRHPYGWNDGSMLPSSGYQQLISVGLAGKFGPINFQFNPEFYYADNNGFQGFPEDAFDVLWQRYYGSQLNFIDTPESFGQGPIRNFFVGQSSIKVDLGPMSFGWSNQNLWWGPGRRNSLVMSNNARGFQHLTLNTNKPINTPIGYLEGQIIGGRLESSGSTPPNSFLYANGRFLYNPRNEDWRYLSGITMTYQPKWTPGLSLGFSRVVQQYAETAKENNDYLGAVSNLFRENDSFDDIVRDQLASIFFRYFWTKTNSEVYFEFARNDAAFNLRDFFMEPNHSAGYLFGFRKLFPFRNKENQFIESSFEWTILAQSSSRAFRNASTFYIHSRVRHGYTNRGEILGAGIGPSSNSQTLEVNWVSGLKKIGLRLERVTRNEDLYIDLFTDIKSFLRPWVDASAFLNGSWQFDNLILDGHIGFIKSFNYQYQIFSTTGFKPGHVDIPNLSVGLDLYFLL